MVEGVLSSRVARVNSLSIALFDSSISPSLVDTVDIPCGHKRTVSDRGFGLFA